MDTQRQIADHYQGLFNLMSNEHNLILTISEMDEIIIEAQRVVNKISSKPLLAVSGCDHEAENGGDFWRCKKCGERM